MLLCMNTLVVMYGGGRVCGYVCVEIWLKGMFAQIHTVYSRLQFQVRVRFIVKYSVTTSNYITDCLILWQSCNYSTGFYLKQYTLNCLLPGGEFNTVSNTPIYSSVSLMWYEVVKHWIKTLWFLLKVFGYNRAYSVFCLESVFKSFSSSNVLTELSVILHNLYHK